MKLHLARLFAITAATLLVAGCASTDERFANARKLVETDPGEALATFGAICDKAETPAATQSSACMNAGRIEARRGNLDQALQWHRKSVVLTPQDPLARSQLAEVHDRLGHYNEARTHALSACNAQTGDREQAAHACGVYVRAARAEIEQSPRPQPEHTAWIDESNRILSRLCRGDRSAATRNSDKAYCANLAWVDAQKKRLETEHFERIETACLSGANHECARALALLPADIPAHTERGRALRLKACQDGATGMCGELLAGGVDPAALTNEDRDVLVEVFERFLPELTTLCQDPADRRCEILLARGDALKATPLRPRLAELHKARDLLMRQASLRRDLDAIDEQIADAERLLGQAEAQGGQRQQQAAIRKEIAGLQRMRQTLVQRIDALAKAPSEPAPRAEAPPPPPPKQTAPAPRPEAPPVVMQNSRPWPDSPACNSRTGDILQFTHAYRSDPAIRRLTAESPRGSGENVMNGIANTKTAESDEQALLDELNKEFIQLLGTMEKEIQKALPLFDLPEHQVRALFGSGDDASFDIGSSTAYGHFDTYWTLALRANLRAAQIACVSRTEPSPVRPSGLSPIRRARTGPR